MKTIKLVLMLCGAIFLLVLAFLLFGVVTALVQYLIVIGAVVLLGMLAYKVLRNPERTQPQLTDFKQHDKDLARVRRTLAEYKRKELPK
ncbi:MAG TPA: hypothetical protein VE821_16700 [Pyrinomonadaceae bacterium]|nr:hypothetical protein [Pyrinomonadaceae bacterium]